MFASFHGWSRSRNSGRILGCACTPLAVQLERRCPGNGKGIVCYSHVLVFTLVVSVCAGIFFGLAPAIQIARREPGGALKEVSRGTTAGRERHRFQRMLVAGQL